MRLKKPNAMARARALVALVLSAMALTAAPALALPEGRVYEQVSPVYKGGYSAEGIMAVGPEGDGVVFVSRGGFAGLLSAGANASNFYLARRGESGWSTVSLEPAFGVWADVSANLEYALGTGALGPNVGVKNYAATEEVFQLHRTDAPETAEEWGVFGGMVLKPVEGGLASASEVGGSADLCHIVLEGRPLLLEAVGTIGQVYDLARGCGGEPPSLRLVGLNNQPTPTVLNRFCPVSLGIGVTYTSGTQTQEINFDAVAAGGSEMLFTSGVVDAAGCGGSHQLFVRLGGSRTLEVSRPLEAGKAFGGCVAEGVPGEVPCEGAAKRASANFSGASEDSSRVYFTTTAPLTGGDKDTGNDLYMARIGCPPGEPECEAAKKEVTSLVQVSHDSNEGEAAEVQGVVKIARDGSHVYFVARGALGEGSNAEGQVPVRGADNLYVYSSTSATTAFVADLCSGPGLSGTVEDARCPSDLETGGGSRNDTTLWVGHFPEAQTNSCTEATPGCEAGRFQVFSTYAQLLPSDTDSAKDVYRYDAETGALDRVSLGEDGADANGNDNAFDATIALGHVGGPTTVHTQYETAARAISEDGSRIVFSTAARLSPDATNGLVNPYEWHKQPGWSEGRVSIVSSGSAQEPDEQQAVISPSGRDIFFTTVQGLVPQDTDGQLDIYDARLDGGFAPVPAERERCEGDACQGSLTNPAPLLVPGSVSQAPGGNFAAPATTVKAKAKVKKKAKPKKKKKKKKSNNRRAKR